MAATIQPAPCSLFHFALSRELGRRSAIRNVRRLHNSYYFPPHQFTGRVLWMNQSLPPGLQGFCRGLLIFIERLRRGHHLMRDSSGSGSTQPASNRTRHRLATADRASHSASPRHAILNLIMAARRHSSAASLPSWPLTNTYDCQAAIGLSPVSTAAHVRLRRYPFGPVPA